MKNITILIVVLFLIMPGTHDGSSASLLDDHYHSAIISAGDAMRDKVKAKYLRNILRESMYAWPKRQGFAEVRRQVSALAGIKSQFRLEIGNINSGSYEVVWVVETNAEISVFSNVFSPLHVVHAATSRSKWEYLLLELSKLKRANACKSAVEVSDGSSYFGTFASGSRVESFAVYGAITFPRATTSDRLRVQLFPCSEIILRAYELAQSPTIN
jgi:hypothetical protein